MSGARRDRAAALTACGSGAVRIAGARLRTCPPGLPGPPLPPRGFPCANNRTRRGQPLKTAGLTGACRPPRRCRAGRGAQRMTPLFRFQGFQSARRDGAGIEGPPRYPGTDDEGPYLYWMLRDIKTPPAAQLHAGIEGPPHGYPYGHHCSEITRRSRIASGSIKTIK